MHPLAKLSLDATNDDLDEVEVNTPESIDSDDYYDASPDMFGNVDIASLYNLSSGGLTPPDLVNSFSLESDILALVGEDGVQE